MIEYPYGRSTPMECLVPRQYKLSVRSLCFDSLSKEILSKRKPLPLHVHLIDLVTKLIQRCSLATPLTGETLILQLVVTQHTFRIRRAPRRSKPSATTADLLPPFLLSYRCQPNSERVILQYWTSFMCRFRYVKARRRRR